MATINIPGAVPSLPKYQQGDNYVLHDPEINKNTAYYKELLAGAKKSIRILDPYAFNGNDSIRVFEVVSCDNITIEIYTTGYDKKEIESCSDNIRNVIKKNMQHYTLKIVSFKEYGVRNEQKISLWHDRYLIIDDKDFYLVGNSLDGQQMSMKYHGIYHLNETKDKEIVANLYKYYQNHYNSQRGFSTTRQKP